MATKDALGVYLASIEKRTYYDILRIRRDVDAAAIKRAFHEFSLLYHPDRYVDSPRDVASTASEIYKRGVEAYRCLSRKPLRERYDRGLEQGKLRYEPADASAPPPPPVQRTLADIARTPRGQQHAVKADRFITAGNLEQARVALVSALQCEPDNAELSERLQILFEALALEPG
jgi:curved DNA-binding protein CbpA